MKCSLNNWKDKLPIAKWLPLYSFNKLQCDFIAGITVGLMVIPQGLAYAVIAGLPPQYGLYSAFFGGFVYCLFGSSKDISIGPTAIMSLMVANYGSSQDPVNFALALSFFCGIIWLVMAIFSLGFIVRLIPIPVISGFTSSAAIIIACSQLKSIFGVSGIPREFFPGIVKLCGRLGDTNVWDLILALACMVVLEFLRSFNSIQWPPEDESPPTRSQKISRKIIWLTAVGRNAIVVFISALIAMSFHSQDSTPFSLTGKVKEGLPSFEVPKLEANGKNGTISTYDMISHIGDGFIVIPLIGLLEDIAIAQAFARRNRYNVDATQELFALGVANLLGSFFSGYPITGSFSRTTVNCLSGVATPIAGIFTGSVVLLALSLLTPFFQYIPKASLAAIIFMSVLRMVDFKIVKKIWQTNRIDVLPLVITFLVCFYELDIGILCGTGIALIVVLHRHFIPRIDTRPREICVFKLNGGLSYMGIEHLMAEVRQCVIEGDIRPDIVLIDCHGMPDCDFTVTQGFHQIFTDCDDRGVQFVITNAQEHVKGMLLDGLLPPNLFRDDLDDEAIGLLAGKEASRPNYTSLQTV